MAISYGTHHLPLENLYLEVLRIELSITDPVNSSVGDGVGLS